MMNWFKPGDVVRVVNVSRVDEDGQSGQEPDDTYGKWFGLLGIVNDVDMEYYPVYGEYVVYVTMMDREEISVYNWRLELCD